LSLIPLPPSPQHPPTCPQPRTTTNNHLRVPLPSPEGCGPTRSCSMDGYGKEEHGGPRNWEAHTVRHENEPRFCRGSFITLFSSLTPIDHSSSQRQYSKPHEDPTTTQATQHRPTKPQGNEGRQTLRQDSPTPVHEPPRERRGRAA